MAAVVVSPVMQIRSPLSALRRNISLERAAPVVSGIVILLVWQVGVNAFLADYVATPAGIVAAFPTVITSAEFWTDFALTASAVIRGMLAGSAFGVLVGIVMGRVPEVNWFLTAYIRTLYALPVVTLVPLVIIWVGYQPVVRLVIVFISVFLPVAVSTADGTRVISRDFLDVAKVFGARTSNIWFGIALPSAIPYIASGIEIGFARGVTNAIAVEVLASVNGLGMSVFTKSAELNENASLVYVVCLACFAIALRMLISRVRRTIAPWYRT